MASQVEIERFRALFDRWGGAAVIANCMLPILPELISILAGLAPMNLRRFLAALLLGTVPTCLLFSYLGYASRNAPAFGIAASVLLPLMLWPFFLKWFSAITRSNAPMGFTQKKKNDFGM